MSFREDIVIGHSLKAVLFAYYNNFPIILNSRRGPFRFDELPNLLADFPTKNEYVIWSTLIFEMSMKGLAPHGTDISSIRITDDVISTTIRESVNIKTKFGKCHIFEDDKLTVENEIVKQEKKMFRVFDWMSVRSGAVHDLDKINTDDDFVNTVYFYKSERIDGNHNKKDLVSVSLLDEKQLALFDYSDTMAKFKIENLMRENGIKGAKSGLNKLKKPKRYNIKVEPSYREVISTNRTHYQNSDNVLFPDLSVEEIVQKYA